MDIDFALAEIQLDNVVGKKGKLTYTETAAILRTCIHKRLSKVWRWEIFTTACAEAMEIS